MMDNNPLNRLTDNPIVAKIPMILPIKTISISTPAKPLSGIMLWIKYDAGMDMADPDVDKKFENKIKTTGWSRMSDTYIRLDCDWYRPEDIERWVSEIGWALGGGYMYRWHSSPGRPKKHLWGTLQYEVMGSSMAEGDTAPELAELCEQLGCWQWEINCAYKKDKGHSKMYFDRWRKADPTLETDGSRSTTFPGWESYHPFLEATKTGTGYESRYYFCKPKKYHKDRDVLPNPQTD